MKPGLGLPCIMVLMSLVPALWLSGCSAGVDHAVVERGDRLFHGRLALSASILGQGVPLNSEAARCVNCHSLPATEEPAFGPELFGERLTMPIRRRGGPPSSYRLADFCRALRTGIDPAQVTLMRSMPLYVMSDEDCLALWSFLTRPH